MARTWLVIDSTNLATTMWHAIATPMVVKGMPTNAIYGFLKMVIHLKDKYAASGMVFCFDKGESLRKRTLPEYQSGRTKDPALQRQIHELRTAILPEIGFNNVLAMDGYEADDLVAAACNHWAVKRAVIVSSDKDLYQCICDNRDKCVSMHNLGTKQEITHAAFFEKYTISPHEWPVVKAMAGCVSDKIPGIEGVGETTAIKYLHGVLPQNRKTYTDIKKSSDLIMRNLTLVTLPYLGMQAPSLQEDEDDFNSWSGVLSRLNATQLLRV